MLLLIFLIIFIILFIIILIIKTLTLNEIINFTINYFNVNIKAINKNNLNNFNNKKVIIMSNHYNGLDYGIIINAINNLIRTDKKIFAVAKHNAFGDKTDDNIISNIFGLFQNRTFNFFNLIPYIRGNKDSGTLTKNIMLEKISNNHSVLIFPEGETTRTGIPQNFRPGSFKLCADNNIYILPVTLKYDKNIGVNRTEPININNWHNTTATIIFHPLIYNKDADILMQQVFNKIREPFIKDF
jgi:1-acyl-sn-glycerol-3-phosphate acyltransferase